MALLRMNRRDTLCARVFWVAVLLTLLCSPLSGVSSIARATELTGLETGLPLPRYVSLKSGKVNVRVGPSRNHAVAWIYQRKGLPVEVIAEFEHWRRIRDSDGEMGWVYHSLLDGDRTAILRPERNEETAPLFQLPDMREIIAAAEDGVIGEVEACNGSLCRVAIGDYVGWVPKGNLWGVYGDEEFE
ncbi:MAG: SH3 domain-containing protein [Parvibaculum sp.]